MEILLDNIHIHHQITDYLLDLLPVEERAAVARHIAGCEGCRLAVQREREIGRLVQTTLNKVTMPDYGRLQALMPGIPNKRPSLLALLMPYRQWAVACCLILIMMGAFLFGADGVFGRFAQPAAQQQATISFVTIAGTAETITTSEAGTLLPLAAQPTASVEQSRIFTDNAPEDVNVPAAPLPVAPQVTPAPEATYFQ